MRHTGKKNPLPSTNSILREKAKEEKKKAFAENT